MRFLRVMTVAAVGFSVTHGAMAACEVPPAGATEAALLDELAGAETEALGFAAAQSLWEIWLTAPDATSQEMLDAAIERREAYAFAESEALLDELVAYCPDYAEAYNQRAFTRFLREDYDGALEDIDRTLEGRPKHFGALSGKVLVLMRQGRSRLALSILRDALEIHPWLRERALLPEGERKL